MKNSFNDSTYSLAKGLHFIELAKQYLEDVRFGTSGDIKMIFSSYINRCDWILGDLKNRLSPENKAALENELKSSLVLNALMDKAIHLDDKQMCFIEDMMDALINKKEIKIIENE